MSPIIRIGKHAERASQLLMVHIQVTNSTTFIVSPNNNVIFKLFSLLNILPCFKRIHNSSILLNVADINQPLISLIVKPDFIICSMCAGWV